MSTEDEQFPPRPGGLVDTARKTAAEPQGSPGTVADDNGPVAYSAVRVRPEAPDTGTARTVTLSSGNPVARILPQDAQRRSAVVLAVDNDVYLSANQGSAEDAQGSTTATGVFYLPAGIAIPIDTQATLWAACTTTATSSRVSVLITRDSQP